MLQNKQYNWLRNIRPIKVNDTNKLTINKKRIVLGGNISDWINNIPGKYHAIVTLPKFHNKFININYDSVDSNIINVFRNDKYYELNAPNGIYPIQFVYRYYDNVLIHQIKPLLKYVSENNTSAFIMFDNKKWDGKFILNISMRLYEIIKNVNQKFIVAEHIIGNKHIMYIGFNKFKLQPISNINKYILDLLIREYGSVNIINPYCEYGYVLADCDNVANINNIIGIDNSIVNMSISKCIQYDSANSTYKLNQIHFLQKMIDICNNAHYVACDRDMIINISTGMINSNQQTDYYFNNN
jgi:hypothetical protein